MDGGGSSISLEALEAFWAFHKAAGTLAQESHQGEGEWDTWDPPTGRRKRYYWCKRGKQLLPRCPDLRRKTDRASKGDRKRGRENDKRP